MLVSQFITNFIKNNILEDLWNSLSKYFEGLSLDSIAPLLNEITERQLKAGEVYIQEGENSKKMAFIRQGLIRVSKEKDNAEEITLLMRWENQFVGSYDSILFNKPTRFSYIAVENTSLFEVDYEKMDAYVNQTLALQPLKASFLMSMIGEALERIESFILFSPEQRYLNLLKENPGIINRIAGKHIATMLGITPVSLSRIRNRIVKK